MLLAWAMNGEALEPDHGFPLRLVVPGQIGGRSVKWLKKIEVSDKESQHHLHFWVSFFSLCRHLSPRPAILTWLNSPLTQYGSDAGQQGATDNSQR